MHVVVTGASAGIGAAIARELAKLEGAKLTLVSRRAEALRVLGAELGVEVAVYARDLSDPAQATDWLEEAVARFGPVEVLVNNAGVQIIEPAHTMDVERGEAMLRLNVHTPLRLTRAVLPSMLARRAGHIVDVASMAAITPTPGMYYYNAAKGALATASEGLRGELRGTGVHVMTVYPGPVDTDMGRAGFARYEPGPSTKLLPVGRADELGVLVRRGIERRRPRIVYPRLYALTRWLPNLSRWFTARFSPKVRVV